MTVGLIKHVLEATPQHGVILDPFMGSGTIAIACAETNRFCIGIEKSRKIATIAYERIQKHHLEIPAQ